jgi:hypothetical protein
MTDAGIDHWLPQPGDSLFVSDESGDPHMDLQYFRDNRMELSYIEAFRASGDAIVNSYVDTHEWYREDALFMSALFNYRHYIELRLKFVLETGIVWNICPLKKKKLRDHNLRRLWRRAKVVIVQVWPDLEPSSLAALETLIRQIHSLDHSGQSFRYSSDTKGRTTMRRAPERVNVKNLQYIMLRVHRFFLSLVDKTQEFYNTRTWHEFQATMPNR